MTNPNNRMSEVLLCFIENKNVKNPLSYLDIARATGNNNVHRYRKWLEDEGVKFNEITLNTKNRYGRPIKYKRFKLVSTLGDSQRIFNRINK